MTSRPPEPCEVAAALSAHTPAEIPALPGRTNHLRAGVLVPLVWGPDLSVLLTVRAHSLALHAAEVSFPGGKPEKGDADLQATALREAREEIGIRQARVLGRLSSMPIYTSDYRLEPFVAAVPAAPLAPQPGEVARILRLGISQLLDREHTEGVPYELHGRSWLSPIFRSDGATIYGATAHTLHELLSVLAPLYGVAVPPLRACGLNWTDLLGRSR